MGIQFAFFIHIEILLLLFLNSHLHLLTVQTLFTLFYHLLMGKYSNLLKNEHTYPSILCNKFFDFYIFILFRMQKLFPYKSPSLALGTYTWILTCQLKQQLLPAFFIFSLLDFHSKYFFTSFKFGFSVVIA